MLFKSDKRIVVKGRTFVAWQLETDDKEVIERLLKTPWVEVVKEKKEKVEETKKIKKSK